MSKIEEISMGAVGIIMIVVIAMVVTDERSYENVVIDEPLLYCQYGAGYGKRVFAYDFISDSEIVSDTNEVFSLTMCVPWSDYVGK